VPVHSKAPAANAILGNSGLIDGYISYPVGIRSVSSLIRVWWQILKYRPDVLVYLNTSERKQELIKRDATFFHFCGIRRIVGLPIGDLAVNQYDAATFLWESEAARLLRCLRGLGSLDINDLRNWDLRLTEAELGKAREVLAPAEGHPIIACGPGTKMQSKDWGQEKWLELLTRLGAKFPGHALILIGAADDEAIANYAAAHWQGPLVNLCGKLTLRESAAVLRQASAFLGPDSGPMHLAAAYGVPCAIAFASVDRPGRWFPIGHNHQLIWHLVECFNCRLNTCIEKKKICINSISVDEMFEAALKVIAPQAR
jgi:ADP-heptose:LPS heptosyltransferase